MGDDFNALRFRDSIKNIPKWMGIQDLETNLTLTLDNETSAQKMVTLGSFVRLKALASLNLLHQFLAFLLTVKF